MTNCNTSIEASQSYRCRFVVHKNAPSGDHIDLFIEVPGRETLYTYEVDLAYRAMLTAWRALPLRAEERQTMIVSGDFSLPVAKKKFDHRPVYMNYTGVLQGGRGEVEELFSGTISGFFTETITIHPEK